MIRNVVIAGFGGQGIMLAGQLLSYAGLAEGKETVWMPSYGPEMRGGTANCTVSIDDKPIGSPVIYYPDSTIVMNKPSLDKFGPAVKPGGLIIVNSSLIPTGSGREDVEEHHIPANAIADEMGTTKAANMVVLGYFLALTGMVKLESVKAMIVEKLGHKKGFVELNHNILDRTYKMGKKRECAISGVRS